MNRSRDRCGQEIFALNRTSMIEESFDQDNRGSGACELSRLGHPRVVWGRPTLNRQRPCSLLKPGTRNRAKRFA